MLDRVRATRDISQRNFFMTTSAGPSHPVFVVGFYRSGTSLLHALLNQHPAISLMYECDILKLWPLAGSNFVRRDWLGRLEYWNQTLSRHRIPEMSAVNVLDRRGAALALYRAFAGHKGAMVIGEKSPYYHNCLPRLANDFPDARIIVLWRSPDEILRSIRKAAAGERFFARRDWPQRIEVGLRDMARGCRRLAEMGHSVHEVDYASLIGNQDQTLREICDFIGVEFDPRMASLEGADLSMLPAGEHHRNVRGGRVLAGQATIATSHDNWSPTVLLSSSTRSMSLNAARLVARDAAVRALYTYCPLGLLGRWRRWRGRKFNGHESSVSAESPHRASLAGL
jgi:hypothetical protein